MTIHSAKIITEIIQTKLIKYDEENTRKILCRKVDIGRASKLYKKHIHQNEAKQDKFWSGWNKKLPSIR